MAKKQKLLTKSQILARLKKAGGNPWDEVFKILGVPLNSSGLVEQETDNQIYKVNFVSHKLDRSHDDER